MKVIYIILLNRNCRFDFDVLKHIINDIYQIINIIMKVWRVSVITQVENYYIYNLPFELRSQKARVLNSSCTFTCNILIKESTNFTAMNYNEAHQRQISFFLLLVLYFMLLFGFVTIKYASTITYPIYKKYTYTYIQIPKPYTTFFET